MKAKNEIKITPMGYVIGKDRYNHSEEWYETRAEAESKANGSPVLALELDRHVWRLNTLPDEKTPHGRKVLDEIRWRLRVFGECALDWTCIGHTRSRWQTCAAAATIRELMPECRVEINQDDDGLWVYA